MKETFEVKVLDTVTVVGRAKVHLVEFSEGRRMFGLQCAGSGILYKRRASDCKPDTMQTIMYRCKALLPVEIKDKMFMDNALFAGL